MAGTPYYPIKLKLYQSTGSSTLAASMEYDNVTNNHTLLKGADTGTGKLVLDTTTVFLGDKTGTNQSLQARLSSLETSIGALGTYATKAQVDTVGDEIATNLTNLQTRIYNIENVLVNHLDLLTVGSNTTIGVTNIP